MGKLFRGRLLFATLALSGFRVSAPASDGPPVPAAPYEPPALTFPEDRIGLMEAIELTLQHNPNIQLQEQQARFDQGVAQTATGQFDLTLFGDYSFSYVQTALTKSQTAFEQKRRDDIQEGITTATGIRDDALSLRDQYQAVQEDPTGNRVNDTLRQSEIDLLNTLIASSEDADVKAAYAQVRDEVIAREIEVQQQIADEAQTNINEAEQKLFNLGEVPREQYLMTSALDLRLSEPTRSGTTFGLFANADFTRDRYRGKSKLADFGGKGIEDLYSMQVGFSVDAALLRGRGVDATGAAEKAAKIDYEASVLTFKHSAAINVLNTILAYWNLAAAQEQLDVARKSAALQTERVKITRALITGDELPKAELSRVLASEAADLGLVSSAERAVNESRVALARSMGLSVLEEANAPLAADPLPEAPDRTAIEAADPRGLIATAITRRYDRQAALRLEESGGVLLQASHTNLRPLLNAHAEVSGGSIAETSLGQTFNAWSGPSYALFLEFQKPLKNNAAKGQLLQSDALWRQRSITRADLERNIKASVVQEMRSLRDAADFVESAADAVRFYSQTIDAENEKYRLGQSTLIDTILTQQLQTDALLTYAASKQQYAQLLAQLRFETGTLVGDRAGGSFIVRTDLFTLPPATPAGPATQR